MRQRWIVQAKRTTVMVALAGSLKGLLACQPVGEMPVATTARRASLERADLVERVSFQPRSAELTLPAQHHLDAVIAALPSDWVTSVEVTATGAGTASPGARYNLEVKRAEAVATYLRRRGVPKVEVGPVYAGPVGRLGPSSSPHGLADAVEIRIATAVLNIPECDSWSVNVASDPANQSLAVLGCATSANLAAMIPSADAVVSDVGPARADGTREAEAIVRYRTDKVKELLTKSTTE